MPVKKLESGALYRRCDAAQFEFETTAELDDLTELIGQPRAVEAVNFGVGIQQQGYNLFALGPAGTGKQAFIQHYVETHAADEAVPPDWCYVNNFADHRQPRALKLPPGKAAQLHTDMDMLIEELGVTVPAVFQSDEYTTRAEAIDQELNERQEQAFDALNKKAEAKNIMLMRTPTGFTLAPMRDGKPIFPKEFRQLPKKERKQIEEDSNALQEELRDTLHKAPQWQEESRQKFAELNREMAVGVVTHRIDALRDSYQQQAEVVQYLNDVEEDIIANFRKFLPEEQRRASLFGIELPGQEDETPWFNRYRVNVLLAHDVDGGAPVVYESLPSYNNLVGRIEHTAQQGALLTDFTMIRAGALHRANGGYLLLDALKLLSQPFAWEALKRALESRKVKIESVGQFTSLISTVSLEPESIPLDIKVVLMGEPIIYYLLSYYDSEFADLFKVQVDFGRDMDRSVDSQQQFARLLATLARKQQLLPFDRDAVARVIEHSARLADDNEKLTTHMRSVQDLMQESDYWARERGESAVSAVDVQRAIDAGIYRADRIRERIQEEIQRGTIMIETSGTKVGEINGLSVMMLGGFSFGRPSRISARVRLGKGNVVDIEREVKMGGPIHSKGVLILSHFLGARYALDYPLSLSASLVFEQSYGGIEGDSASSAELYALLSALADIPIRQSLAVTGSVNQHGEIQAIGGVNEKIEGFFDLCSSRGLSGDEGVLIPASNVKHLMLRHDVVSAVEEGRFSVYPVSTVDEGVELLTGVSAGVRDQDGKFPPDSINRRIEDRLIHFSLQLKRFAREGKNDNNSRDRGK
ncbi:MAG: AAA family ATPase [Gammaproteobacteria bacterium]|nr:AAA family ATPase [Gammaproteobacteria bacterium]